MSFSRSLHVCVVERRSEAMKEARKASWYREEADRARAKAAAAIDPVLRDSYLQVADAYDQLAETLDRIRPRVALTAPGL